ncbi:hypothetical protein HPG69_019444 [Diceros bicornis minor]|uniref:Uncharacterized protein n=1 Tax=Diceros bicornis minor TaxID=77932 RepID=A0A7J7F081_DICBM|nr:hypothetical protein HPG69_019444 [Diceros bicornis minor]
MKEQAKVFSPEIKQIDLDVNYTFHNHIIWDHWAWSECPQRPALFSPLPALRRSLKKMGWPSLAHSSSVSSPDPRLARLSLRPGSSSMRGCPQGPQLQATLWGPRDLRLACLPPAQDSSWDWLRPRRRNSLPNLPVNHKAAGRWPPDISFELERWVPFPSTAAWATPKATQWAWPCNPNGAPVTGPAQPAKDRAVRAPDTPPDLWHLQPMPFLGQ